MVDNRTTQYGGRNPPPLIDVCSLFFLVFFTENLDMWWDPSYIFIIQAQLALIGSLAVIERRIYPKKQIPWTTEFFALLLPIVLLDTYIWKWTFEEFNIRFPGVVEYIRKKLGITLQEWVKGYKRIFGQSVLQKVWESTARATNGEFRIGLATKNSKVFRPLMEALLYLDHALLPNPTTLAAKFGFVQIKRFVTATSLPQYENMRFVQKRSNKSNLWDRNVQELLRLTPEQQQQQQQLQLQQQQEQPAQPPQQQQPPQPPQHQQQDQVQEQQQQHFPGQQHPQPRRPRVSPRRSPRMFTWVRNRFSSSSSSNNNDDDNEDAVIDNGNGFNEDEIAEEVNRMRQEDWVGLGLDHNGGGGRNLEIDEPQRPPQQRDGQHTNTTSTAARMCVYHLVPLVLFDRVLFCFCVNN